MSDQERFLRRVSEILHPASGIKGEDVQKAMICEAYDIHIAGLKPEHAESRTEPLIDKFRARKEWEEEQYNKALWEQIHDR